MDLATATNTLEHAPVDRFLEAMAVQLDAEKAAGKEMIVNLVFTDVDASYVLALKNSVVRHYAREPHPDANVTLRITKGLYLRMLAGKAGIKDTLFGDELEIEGSRLDLIGFFRLLDKRKGTFNIVAP